MRFLSLVSVVVIAIFAAAFGVYHWLGGGSDSTVQIVTPQALPADADSVTSSSNPVIQDGNPAPQEPVVVNAPVQEAPADGVAGSSSETETASAANPVAAVGQGLTPSADQQTSQAVATEPSAPEPRTPQVVARIIEKAESETVARPSGDAPSFDVVRVEKSGEAILAGRAPAGSEVTIYDGDTPLGIVTADSRGQWVLVLDIPLVPGSHSLGVTARLPDETQVESAELVIVAVPEPQDRVQTARDATPAADATAQQAETTLQQTDVGAADGNVLPDASEDNNDAPDSPITPSQVAVADTGVEEPIAVIVPRQGAGPARILQKPNTAGEGIGNGNLFLDSVDYDDDGRAVIGGRANAGAALIIYLDNIPVGEALTGDDGRWAMTPEDLVPVGLHRLRVDQVQTDGKVLARVETPFSRADTIASHPDENFVTVQPGNSLWRIARTTYGQGTRYTVIYEINREQIRDPDLIYPGQIFRLPSDG